MPSYSLRVQFDLANREFLLFLLFPSSLVSRGPVIFVFPDLAVLLLSSRARISPAQSAAPAKAPLCGSLRPERERGVARELGGVSMQIRGRAHADRGRAHADQSGAAPHAGTKPTPRGALRGPPWARSGLGPGPELGAGRGRREGPVWAVGARVRVLGVRALLWGRVFGEAGAYLPGRGDTMIRQVVFPGRGSSPALRVC